MDKMSSKKCTGNGEKERSLGLFMTFNIIISHIFPENFIEIPEVVQKI